MFSWTAIVLLPQSLFAVQVRFSPDAVNLAGILIL